MHVENHGKQGLVRQLSLLDGKTIEEPLENFIDKLLLHSLPVFLAGNGSRLEKRILFAVINSLDFLLLLVECTGENNLFTRVQFDEALRKGRQFE